MRPWFALLALVACDPPSEAPPDATELTDTVIGDSDDGVLDSDSIDTVVDTDAVDTVFDTDPVDTDPVDTDLVTCTPGDVTPLPYGGPVGTEGVGTCHAGEATCRLDGLGWDEAPEVLPRWEDCRASEDEDCDGGSACPVTPSCVVELPAHDAYFRPRVAHADGRTVVAGSFWTYGTVTGVPHHDDGFFLMEVDDTCRVVWRRLFFASQNGDLEVTALDLAPDGGVVIGGHFAGTLDLGGEPAGQQERSLFLTRYDGRGAHVATRVFAGPNVSSWWMEPDLEGLGVRGDGEIFAAIAYPAGRSFDGLSTSAPAALLRFGLDLATRWLRPLTAASVHGLRLDPSGRVVAPGGLDVDADLVALPDGDVAVAALFGFPFDAGLGLVTPASGRRGRLPGPAPWPRRRPRPGRRARGRRRSPRTSTGSSPSAGSGVRSTCRPVRSR